MLRSLRRLKGWGVQVATTSGRGQLRTASAAPGLSRLRNIGIIAHIDAGKTTTSEQMLFLCGETKSVGRVDTGDTVMDFLPQERERGITIQAAAITLNWKGHSINLIDTPGHVDFTIEVERSVRVIDGAVIIVDAVSGVQAQTKTVWRQAQKHKLPAVAFVNKMDRDGASFARTLESIRSKLGANVVALQQPIFASGGSGPFVGVVDLLTLSTTIWGDGEGGSGAGGPRSPARGTVSPLLPTEPLFPSAKEARRDLVERLVETDESLMEQYLEQGEDSVSVEQLLTAMRSACHSGALVPVMCGASLKGRGVEPLLDAVVALLPSPLDRPDRSTLTAVHKNDPSRRKALDPAATSEGALCLLAFKIVYDKARGPLVFVRSYSGSLTAKTALFNSSRGQRERVNQLLTVTADDLSTLPALEPGNVACIVGLKHTETGDTLVADKSPLRDHVLPGLVSPKPVFSLSVEPEQTSQQTELEEALKVLSVEDPSLRVELDKESGQTLLRGVGELHLEIVCDKLRRSFGIEVATGKAYVAYRETLFGAPDDSSSAPASAPAPAPASASAPAEEHIHRLSYDKIVGTKRMSAALTVAVEPLGGAEDPEVVVDKEGTACLTNDERVSLVDGLAGALSRGPRGFPVVGVRVRVLSAERDGDTTPGAVRACCSVLVDRVLRGPSHALLEPLMALEAELPLERMGDVLSDLTVQRRAIVKEVQTEATHARVFALVPLATMLGYATALRSMTGGEGSFSLEFAEYSPPMDPQAVPL